MAYEAVNALKDIPRDTTAPIFPCDNVRANSTGYRSALIQWDPISDSVDPQSGIAGYEVFRNGIHTKYCLGRLSTSFIDSSLVEQSDYRYSVFPFNAQLVNGPVSATASILTPADRNPPQLLKAVAYANSHFVTLSFDESIDAHSAMQAESFSVEGFSAIVLKSQLQQDGKSVTFETDSIIANKNASISVVGISDVALTPNRITSPQVLPIATGNVDTGIYFRIVNLLASVGMNISASDLIYSNGNAFSEGTTPHFADTLTPSFPNVGILLKGLIAVSVKGQYRFYISSKADTAEFSIGAAPTRNLSRLSKQDSVTIDLQSGLVPFILALSSINKDSIVLDLQWSGPGFARTPIPDSLLFHETSLAPQTGFHGRFLTPVLGQPINPGDSVSVSWTQENTDESLQLLFEISFSKGKKWQQLLSTAVNSKSNGFIWHVPNLFPGVLLPIDSVFIRASEYGNHDQYVYSSYFRILASSSIKPTSYGHSMVFDKILIHAVQKNNVLISVNASEPGAIKIIDLKGRKVLFASIKKGSNTAQLKISNGIYGFQILNAHFQVKSVGKFALGMN